jgi:fumarate hydratase subunit alpha
MNYDEIVAKTADTLILASTRFREDRKTIFEDAIRTETVPLSKWTLETLLENAKCAYEKQCPLCDDTGVPHVILEVGKGRDIPADMFQAINDGIALGLRKLPGRPMSVMGDDMGRLDQSQGLDPDPGALTPSSFSVILSGDNVLRLHVLMQGGGPEIRAKTYRIFHRHCIDDVVDEIVEWASEAVGHLGCTPCTLAIGVGRSHFEATAMMLRGMAFGDYEKQTEIEKKITSRVNGLAVGPLGLGGPNTVLATFLAVGPQRASGVRIVCMRPCCCMEPRTASCVF